MLLHGITFAGHPMAAAIALRNIEIFEREGVLENVREHEGYLRDRLNELKDRVPIVGDVRGDGFFWALELVRDEELTRFSAEERERLLRGFLAGRLLEEGLIARPDDRGDAVLHLAPPLICGRRELDELVAKTEAVLADASEALLRVIHNAHGWWLSEAGGAEPVAPAAGEALRRCRHHRRRLRRHVDGLEPARARRARRASGGRRVRSRPERTQRRLLRDAVVEPALPPGPLRRRTSAGRLRGLLGQCARDRRVVRGGGRRRLVPAGGLRRDLHQ